MKQAAECSRRLVLSASKPNDIRRPLGFSRNKSGISPTYRASRDVSDWAPACAGATMCLVLSRARLRHTGKGRYPALVGVGALRATYLTGPRPAPGRRLSMELVIPAKIFVMPAKAGIQPLSGFGALGATYLTGHRPAPGRRLSMDIVIPA